MFDDHQPNQPTGNIPPNLPIGEPEDIFASTENAAEKLRPTGDSIMDQTSALEAGALRVKNENTTAARPMQPVAPRPVASSQTMNQPAPTQENYDLKEPGIGKFIFKLFIVVIVVAVLGGVGWFAYTKLIKPMPESSNLAEESVNIVPENTEMAATSTEVPGETLTEADEKIDEMAGDIQDDAILFGAPVDKDGDNIDDTREGQIGTDPNNWDTDGDGLSDGDEILIWQTDPLKSDTDGDTYPDGSEVKNGYSPRGPGKLFAPPTTTTSSAVTAPTSSGVVVSTNTSTGVLSNGTSTAKILPVGTTTVK